MTDDMRAGARYRFPFLVRSLENPAGETLDPATTRVLFHHLPKTAGSTFRQILEALFEPDEVCSAEIDDEIVELSPEQHRKLRLFGGHFSYDVIEEHLSDALWLVFLRDPIERAVSDYFNLSNPARFQPQWNDRNAVRPDVDKFLKRIEGISLEEYAFLDDPRALDRNVNRQTRYLVPRAELRRRKILYTPYDEWVLETAKANLRERFAFIGVQEEFDLALHLMTLTFGMRPFGEMSAYTNNVNKKKSFRKRYEMPDHVRAHLVEQNRMDLELWAYARELMHERYAAFRAHLLDSGVDLPVDAAGTTREALTGEATWTLADGIRAYGFHRPERTLLGEEFAWTGRQAPSVLEFSADLARGERYELCLRALSAIDEGVRDGVRLVLDGRPLETVVRSEAPGLVYRATFSPDASSPVHWHALEIHGPRSLEPETASYRRPLGIAVQSLSVRPLHAGSAMEAVRD